VPNKVGFVFGVHDHQPIGNFDHVVEEAYQKSYRLFFEVVAAHPKIRLSCHISGCLWDWIIAHHSEFVDALRPLVARGQVEMVSGAYYEPIFPVIPEDDLVGQIEKLSEFLHRTFGKVPEGAWLTERVWEPHLPALLARAGIKYTLVDDWHLKGAGVPEADLHGPFVTEHLGSSVKILPIDERLRYVVPFKEPEKTLARLRSIADAGANQDWLPAGILFDDGEKFGVWPETHDWVYKRGWMDRFLSAMEGASDWVEFLTCGDYLARVPARGPLAMGTASYSEMMEWSLPPEPQRVMARAHAALQAAGMLEEAKPYLKGGTWRGFQWKYPEANWLHKKMLRVSAKVRAAAEAAGRVSADAQTRAAVAQAREALWRGQCNCPYWHGVFGGLYLNYLRHAVWRNLIEAERLADTVIHGKKAWLEVVEADVDADGAAEIVAENDALSVLLRPVEGACASSWEIRARGWNVLDTVARRPEAYHDKLREAVRAGTAADPGAAAQSIHELVRVKEPGLERYLTYDPDRRRGAFQDHLLAAGTTREAFRDGTAARSGDLLRLGYSRAAGGPGSAAGIIVLRAAAPVMDGMLEMEKTFELEEGSGTVQAGYVLTRRGGPLRALLAVEWNLGLLAGDAPDRFITFDGRKPADPRAAADGEETAAVVEAVDGWQKIRVRFRLSEPVTVWRHPVWTVSLSEGGFERTYQSTSLFFLRPLELGDGQSLRFGLAVEVVVDS